VLARRSDGGSFGHRISFLVDLTEEDQPEGEGEERGKARVYKNQRRKLLFQIQAHEKQSRGYCEQNAQQAASYPGRKKRTEDVERRRPRAGNGALENGKSNRAFSNPACPPAES
jgi:hypothetical protein